VEKKVEMGVKESDAAATIPEQRNDRVYGEG
jgi:hypothetical protein